MRENIDAVSKQKVNDDDKNRKSVMRENIDAESKEDFKQSAMKIMQSMPEKFDADSKENVKDDNKNRKSVLRDVDKKQEIPFLLMFKIEVWLNHPFSIQRPLS